MGEEWSAEFHLPGADDGEIISEVLHLLREHFAPFGQILVVAPRVLDFSYEIIEHVRRMRPALLVKLPPHFVQFHVPFGVELVPRKVHISISQQTLKILKLEETFLTSFDLWDEGSIEDGCCRGDDMYYLLLSESIHDFPCALAR